MSSDLTSRSELSEPETGLARLLGLVDEPSSLFETGDPLGAPIWIGQDGWRLFTRVRELRPRGDEFARFTLDDGRTEGAFLAADGLVQLPFSLEEAYCNLISEAWRAGASTRSLTPWQLDLYYRVKRLVPRGVQLGARRVLARRQALPEFPQWPLDETLTRLLRFYGRCVLLASGKQEVPFRWFWPGTFSAALILTHDVESAEGLRLAIDLADAEETRGLRSSFNVVAQWYPIDHGVLRELATRGFEIGVHGIHHDRSMFSSREEFERQLPLVQAAAIEFAAEGFRSPATHRVFEWLAELPVSYDCTMPHSDPFEPQPGGCCSVWPFFIGDVVELPYTLPQDHTLFTVLRAKSIEVWLAQLGRLVELNGLVQSVTHPDPGYLGDYEKRRMYFEFLDAVAERDDLWMPLPREVARWWRERHAGLDTTWPLGIGTVRLEGGEVVLEAPSGPEHVSGEVSGLYRR